MMHSEHIAKIKTKLLKLSTLEPSVEMTKVKTSYLVRFVFPDNDKVLNHIQVNSFVSITDALYHAEKIIDNLILRSE